MEIYYFYLEIGLQIAERDGLIMSICISTCFCGDTVKHRTLMYYYSSGDMMLFIVETE